MKWLLVWFCALYYLFSDTAVGLPAKRNSPIFVEDENVLEEIGEHFEGDIILSPEQSSAVKNGYTALTGLKKWPNNIVYYTIDTSVFTSAQQNNIRIAMDQIELVSCVRFVPRTNQNDYAFVSGTPTSGCSSTLGFRGSEQYVNLQPNGCTGVGTIIHELLHTLGFVHMQSASDRDYYVDINYDAIQEQTLGNFKLYDSSSVTDFGIPYDYESIMHYGKTAFSSNGQNTVIPKKPNVVIGQRNGLSAKDIKRINHQYPDCY